MNELQDHIDLCAAWALGCLDEADRVRLEQHLASDCHECQLAMTEFSAATVLIAASVPRFAPRPDLRQRVLTAATAPATGGAAPQSAPPRSAGATARDGRTTMREAMPERGRVVEMPQRSPWAWVPLAAAALLAVTSGVLWMQSRNLANELNANRSRIAELEKKAAEERKWSEVLFSPTARVSMLEPTTDGDQRLRARATFDPETKRAIVVFENFVEPTARDYELWVIKDGAPVSLGLIKPDAENRATMQLENVGDSFALSAFAVSLEPEGGSPNPAAPSGPVVMLGKLSN